jgi:hypothetical protein
MNMYLTTLIDKKVIEKIILANESMVPFYQN